MKNADKIRPKEAIKLAREEYGISVSPKTMLLWCEKHHIAIKIVGRWYINKKRLEWLLEGTEWKIKNEEREKNQS